VRARSDVNDAVEPGDGDVKLMLFRSQNGQEQGPDLWLDWQWLLVWVGMALRARGVMQAEPFRFLNLGLLAYIGGSEAVAQVQLGESDFLQAWGGSAFVLWRSVYVVKQVYIVQLSYSC
jgi:NADH dehydrogenase FAD-containing subunit